MFSNEKQIFFTIVNKREKVKNSINAEIKKSPMVRKKIEKSIKMFVLQKMRTKILLFL